MTSRRQGCLRVVAIDGTVDSDAGLEIEEQAVRFQLPRSMHDGQRRADTKPCGSSSMTSRMLQ